MRCFDCYERLVDGSELCIQCSNGRRPWCTPFTDSCLVTGLSCGNDVLAHRLGMDQPWLCYATDVPSVLSCKQSINCLQCHQDENVDSSSIFLLVFSVYDQQVCSLFLTRFSFLFSSIAEGWNFTFSERRTCCYVYFPDNICVVFIMGLFHDESNLWPFEDKMLFYSWSKNS